MPMSDTATATPTPGTAPDGEALRRFLDGERGEGRERVGASPAGAGRGGGGRVRAALCDELWEPVWNLPREEYRELVMRWMRRLAEEGDANRLFPGARGGGGAGAGAGTGVG